MPFRWDVCSHRGVPTHTVLEQQRVEKLCLDLYHQHGDEQNGLEADTVVLDPYLTSEYLQRSIKGLSKSYASLDASRPWLCYWTLHALDMLGVEIPTTEKLRFVDLLSRCQHPEGGFAGGPVPGQQAHLAATYAAVNALVILGRDQAYEAIDRPKLRSFLLTMKQSDGSFMLQHDGEIDVRGAYTALAVASLCDILDDELMRGTAEWVASCQTYEGGMGGEPGLEAHGGYTFCGLAAMVILKEEDRLDVDALLRWAVTCQMDLEGGFCGRTNKLVDGCYSFWQGGIFPILRDILARRHPEVVQQTSEEFGDDGLLLFWQQGLKDYLIHCCQDFQRGGLKDKPKKGVDLYHTCYCLSGLSVAQNYVEEPPEGEDSEAAPLNSTYPVFNICSDKVDRVYDYFSGTLTNSQQQQQRSAVGSVLITLLYPLTLLLSLLMGLLGIGGKRKLKAN